MSLCEVWDVDFDCCPDLPDGTDQSLIDKWQAVSSELLWAASGRRYGLCEVTVRPCLRSCWGSGLPTPYKGSDGQWRNFATCGCNDECTCTALCEVVLDGPVDSIEEVLIGEDELMAENYRLDIVDGEYRLLRTDGGCWPSCSDFTAECGTDGAFCVTYMKGLALTELAIAANSALTCQLVRACLPNCSCKLPANVVSVVRSGVSLQFDSSVTWIRTLSEVASFLDVSNPSGLQSGSTVWTPDLPPTRTTVTTEVS